MRHKVIKPRAGTCRRLSTAPKGQEDFTKSGKLNLCMQAERGIAAASKLYRLREISSALFKSPSNYEEDADGDHIHAV